MINQICQVCIAAMGVVGIVGLIATYIDMNNEGKGVRCLVEMIVTLIVITALLLVILIIQTDQKYERKVIVHPALPVHALGLVARGGQQHAGGCWKMEKIGYARRYNPLDKKSAETALLLHP